MIRNFSKMSLYPAKEGYDPNSSTFQVPVQLLKIGTNKLTLQAAPDAQTYFWLYRLEVQQRL
jgi:hypothetical protein